MLDVWVAVAKVSHASIPISGAGSDMTPARKPPEGRLTRANLGLIIYLQAMRLSAKLIFAI